MLLSQESVLYHNEKDKDCFTRYDRVQEYVDNQVKYHYNSKLMNQPNNEANGSISSYSTTASITPSKACIPIVDASVTTRKNKKTFDNVAHASSHVQFPLSKKHGLHLLEKFTSPNLVINRVTHRQSLKRPNIGIFNKGKSSAKGKTKQAVGDLLFSETDFLNPRKQSSISTVSDTSVLSESPYFRSNTNPQVTEMPPPPPPPPPPSIQTREPKKIPHVKRPSKAVKDNKNIAKDPSQYMSRNGDGDKRLVEKEDVTPLKRRKLITNPSPPSIISKISAIERRNTNQEDHRNSHRARPANENGSDHSNDSIRRLLQECQEAPLLENVKTNNNNSASDYTWCPSFSTQSRASRVPPSQRSYSNPENYLPSKYNESTSSYYNPYTNRLTSVEHRLFHIDDYNSDILSPLKTLYEEEDSSLKNFWKNQYARRL